MSGFWYEIGRMQTAGGAIFQGRAESTLFQRNFCNISLMDFAQNYHSSFLGQKGFSKIFEKL